MDALTLEQAAGRRLAARRDSRETRRLLVDGIGSFAEAHGRPPARLADVATHVGLSTATAYRHFASLDDLANAHLARLPELAVARFGAQALGSDDPDAAFLRWNRCWVEACMAHAATAVPLRSAAGFLRRRKEGDPLITYVCAQVEPLLLRCGVPVDVGLVVWNAVSDPREVLDLRVTARRSERFIAEHITGTTLSTRRPAANGR